MSQDQDFSNFRGRQLRRLSEEEFAEGAAECVKADQRRKERPGYVEPDDDFCENLESLREPHVVIRIWRRMRKALSWKS